jgi:hypothetical protein
VANERLKDSSPKRRMGRPPQPTKTARRNRVVTLVTDAELKKLSAIADDENQSLSSLVHQILARHLQRRK